MSNTRRLRGTGARFSLAVLTIFIGALWACRPADPLEHIRELQAQGRFEDSLEPLRELTTSQSGDPEVYYRYGLALLRTGQPDVAVWTLRKAGEDPDWVVSAGQLLASSATQIGSWEMAIEASGRVLEVEPDNLPALMLRANARLNGKSDLEAALADYDRVVELSPDNFEAQAARAATLLSLARIDEAALVIAELEQLARDASLDDGILGHFCVTKATFASEQQALEEAEELFADCLVRFPTHATVLEQAMGFFDGRGSPERATETLAVALERVPRSLTYRDRLARRLRAANEFERSEQILRAGLELEEAGLVAGAWTALADHFVELGDLDAAASAYEESLGLSADPSVKQILALADVLARAGQNERALEVSRRLDNPIYRGLVEARVYLNRGQPRRALESLDQLFPSWPNNPGARYYAARAAEQLGDFDRAIEEYRQSIRSQPEFTDAGLRLARLHEAEGAGEKAWVAATHHRRSHPDDLDAAVYLVRLASRIGSRSRLRAVVAELHGGPAWAVVAAIRADELANEGDPEAAVALLRRDPGIELTLPRDSPALRSLCIHLLAVGRAQEAREAAQEALAAHPEVAAFHEIHGLVLEAQPASATQALAAYQRALELEPENAEALGALGRLAADAGAAEDALALYDRAAAAHPSDPSALRRAAVLAADSGLLEQAEERWKELLREHPWDADAALQLASLQLARGGEGQQTLELARRAVRFRGGEEAERLLAGLRRGVGEAEPAD